MNVERPEDRAKAGLGELQGVVQAEAVDAAEQVVEQRGRRWFAYAIAAAAFVALLISSAVGVGMAQLYSRVTQAEAASEAARRLAEEAQQQGAAANEELRRRGQAPVPIPAPGTAADSEVLTAAAAAKVLAQLPDMRPTAVQLGAAVADYIARHPITPLGPTPGQIAAELAGYFVTNPPPAGPAGPTGAPGPRGEKGDTGPPPKSEDIQREFAAYLQANPNALCPRGGDYAQLRVRLADGQTADTWQCVVTVYPRPTVPPTTTSEVAPPPARGPKSTR
jgi:hypothetical protein